MTSLLNKYIRDVPIKQKLMLLILMTSGITLFASSLVFIAKEALTIGREQRSDLASLADIVGKNTVSALTFNDPQSATDTMASLAAKRNVMAVYVFDVSDRLFSKYVAEGVNTEKLPLERPGVNAAPETSRIVLNEIEQESSWLMGHNGFVSIVHPILLDGEKVGTVLIHSDTRRVISNLLWSIFITALIMAGAFVMAYLISSRLQQLISTPILGLVESMKMVSETKNFSFRAIKPSSDEIGLLYAGFNEMVAEIEERDESLRLRQEHLQQLAHFDTLTRLANRTLYLDRLNQALLYSEREKEAVAVYFIDLDHFKDINDTLGHRTGDNLLQDVARRLETILRNSDTVARLGGDEFTIFTLNIKSSDNARIVAKKIIKLFETPFVLEEREIFMTASIGITLFPLDGKNVDELLMNADIAMYHAKESGKNNYKLYSTGMNERTSERVELQSDLRLAVDRGEFTLFYQPKVDMVSGYVSSVEALIRWNHPKKGMISPVKFIQIAEETGLIEGMTTWVLLTACRQAKEWQDAGHRGIRVAMNLSPYNFKRQNVIETVGKALRETGIDPTLLEIEMTESSLMQNDEYIIATLVELQRLGIKIAIDDFGTGYSSLSYLNRFPINSLKIDSSFVWNMTKSDADLALVTAIIAMANSLKMTVVAEGVETGEQLDILRGQGCQEIQGYLVSKPLPPDKVMELFDKPQLSNFAPAGLTV